MAGYWRITSSGGNFLLYNQTPLGGSHTLQAVQIQVPSGSALEAVSGYGSYDAANPWSFPLTITPTDVASVGVFEDGVYRFVVPFLDSEAVAYDFDEYFLHTPAIDTCINTKLDAYLASACVCKDTHQLQVLQELMVLRQGAHLDLENVRYTQAAQKVTLMTTICAGTGCSCICGC